MSTTQTMPKCRACQAKCTPDTECRARHAKGSPNDPTNHFCPPGRSEPRQPDAALSHLAVHLPNPEQKRPTRAPLPSRSAGRSQGPWIVAVGEEVHEVPDRARHTERARAVQEVGRGARGGAPTLLPAAKTSATSRHRLHEADVPLDHVRAHAKRESWRAVREAPGLRAFVGDVLQWSRQELEVDLLEPAELLAGVVGGRTGCAAPADAATAGYAWAASEMSVWRSLSCECTE